MQHKEIVETESQLNPILKNKFFAWLLLGISFTLMVIDNFLKIDVLVGLMAYCFISIAYYPINIHDLQR